MMFWGDFPEISQQTSINSDQELTYHVLYSCSNLFVYLYVIFVVKRINILLLFMIINYNITSVDYCVILQSICVYYVRIFYFIFKFIYRFSVCSGAWRENYTHSHCVPRNKCTVCHFRYFKSNYNITYTYIRYIILLCTKLHTYNILYTKQSLYTGT